MVARGLSGRQSLENANGATSSGEPYLRLFLPEGALLPGQSIVTSLQLKRQPTKGG